MNNSIWINVIFNGVGYSAVILVLLNRIKSLKESLKTKDDILKDIRDHLQDWDRTLSMYKSTFATLHENYPKDIQMIKDLTDVKIQLVKDISDLKKRSAPIDPT